MICVRLKLNVCGMAGIICRAFSPQKICDSRTLGLPTPASKERSLGKPVGLGWYVIGPTGLTRL